MPAAATAGYPPSSPTHAPIPGVPVQLAPGGASPVEPLTGGPNGAGGGVGGAFSAIAAAVAGVGAMYTVSLLALVAIAAQVKSTLSGSQLAALAAMCVHLEVGGPVDLVLPGGGAGGTAEFVPAIGTVVGLAVLTSMLRRRLDARPSLRAVDVLVAGLLTGVIFVASLAALGLLGRLELNVGSTTMMVSANLVGGVVHGAVLYLIAFALLVAWRFPSVFPSPVRAARDWLAGPCYGAALALVLFAVAAVLAGVGWGVRLFATGGSTSDFSAVLPPVLSAVPGIPNVLLAGFAFALGVPLTITGDAAHLLAVFGSGGTVNVIDAARQQPLVWSATAVGAVVLLIGGMVAALFAPSPSDARKRGAGMGLTLAALLVVVALATRVSVTATMVDRSLDGGALLNLGLAALAGLVWGALAGVIGAQLATLLPVSLAVRANERINRRRAARALPRIGGGLTGPSKPEGTW